MADEDRTDIELHAQATREGLSLKAKGAGLFVLLALDIAGMAWIGHAMAQRDSTIEGLAPGYVPIFLLFVLGMMLAKILAAVLGLKPVDD